MIYRGHVKCPPPKKISPLYHTLKGFLSITLKGGEDSECYELGIRDSRLTTSSRPWSLTTYKLYLTSSHVCSWMSYTGLLRPCMYNTFIQLCGADVVPPLIGCRVSPVAETPRKEVLPDSLRGQYTPRDSTKVCLQSLNLLPWLHLWVCHCYLGSNDLKSMKEHIH